MIDNNNSDIEDSFFKLSNFKKHSNIFHNLNNWHIKMEGWENKAGQIETYLIVPYAEMIIDISEINNDNNFFNKNVARIKISINKDNTNYIFEQKIKITFNERIQYILLDTPFIYPHNWYYIYNREYLRDKIVNSIIYLNNFIDSYKDLFNNNIPLLFINKISETIDEYNFEIIIKEYLDLFYITTNDNANVCINLLLDTNKQKNKSMKFKKINLIIPRVIKNTINTFKFIVGNWK